MNITIMKELTNAKVSHKYLKLRYKTFQDSCFNLAIITDARFFSAPVFDADSFVTDV